MIKKNNKNKSHFGVTLLNSSQKEDSVEQVVFDLNSSSRDDTSSNKFINNFDELTISSTHQNKCDQKQGRVNQQPIIGPYFSPSYQFSTSSSTIDQAKYHQYLSSFSQQQVYPTPILMANNYINNTHMICGIPQQPPMYYPNYQSMNYASLPQHQTLYAIPQPISYYSFNDQQFIDKERNKMVQKKDKGNYQEPKKSFKTQSDNAVVNNKRKSKNKSTTVKIKSKVEYELGENTLSLVDFIDTFNPKKEFINYLCTSKGCKEVQSYLVKATPNIVSVLINEIGSNFDIITTHYHASHFFKNLTNNCNSEQKLNILKYIEPNFCKIAHHSSGTHALQSLLDVVDNEEEVELITSCIKKDFIGLCKVRNNSLYILLVYKLKPCNTTTTYINP